MFLFFVLKIQDFSCKKYNLKNKESIKISYIKSQTIIYSALNLCY